MNDSRSVETLSAAWGLGLDCLSPGDNLLFTNRGHCSNLRTTVGNPAGAQEAWGPLPTQVTPGVLSVQRDYCEDSMRHHMGNPQLITALSGSTGHLRLHDSVCTFTCFRSPWSPSTQ